MEEFISKIGNNPIFNKIARKTIETLQNSSDPETYEAGARAGLNIAIEIEKNFGDKGLSEI